MAMPLPAVATVDEFDVHVLVDRAIAAGEPDALVRRAVLREVIRTGPMRPAGPARATGAESLQRKPSSLVRA